MDRSKKGTMYRAPTDADVGRCASIRDCAMSEGRVDGWDDEGVAEDAAGAGLADGYSRGAFDWADGRAGAGEDGFDLRDGFAHLWMGPLVAGAHQAAGDAGA